MAALLIKNISPEMHRRLRLEADRHHRSMNREILAILEEKLGGARPLNFPDPIRLEKSLSGEWICRVIREMRDSCS